ncbi:MAG: hypothetical protein A3B10_03695 [Candidatus Doudnabacteria bacterium RIFCSPLOWO2_01_FULL_44_21]|uniref:Uncharacterized protein n=1 Tax=Candidatus Doudnabacteria bacterium RIFCSPLOWO2_01_FULL_44_21 TaxID=1817841 RepID=A0A1F5PY68_9BACT|nr:MAG: hypothetical protein A3B95_02150 [Candidatus Doudnabacteria bacterium RIFCSPHIGHO2_02_FULL_43_13b]OGE94866.1 MAG: hypothetical protein A3B10_03695 [Candidatus Doudnabacteria bacterium RIFCSPLOWO2_01_FULL_44_21]
MNNLIKNSFLNALGTAIYIVLVVLLVNNLERFLPKEDNLLMPISALMLFVLSATVTGGLVLGKPVMMYLNGERPEAVRMLIYTLGWLALFTVIAFTISATV